MNFEIENNVLYVSTLDVRGYNLVVVSPSKTVNTYNLLKEAVTYHPQWNMSTATKQYKDEIRTEAIPEFGKVVEVPFIN